MDKKVEGLRVTTDYKKFKFLDGNRKIDPAHIKKLEAKMKENKLFNVIIVNEKFEIIEGQHRFIVCQNNNLPINYIVVNGYGINEVQTYNTNIKVWRSNDFANCYCKLGNENYKKHLDFRKKYGFSHSVTITILVGFQWGRTARGLFMSGDFEIPDYFAATEKAEKLHDFREVYDGWKRRSFVYAMLRIFEKDYYRHKRMIKQLARHKLRDFPSVKYYLDELERIYNYGYQKHNRLRFTTL